MTIDEVETKLDLKLSIDQCSQIVTSRRRFFSLKRQWYSSCTAVLLYVGLQETCKSMACTLLMML